MKNLFITLLLLVSSQLFAQQELNGLWQDEDSSYLTTIIASEYAVLDVFNTSFEEYRVIPEKIIDYKNNRLTTSLKNPLNGYNVQIEYSLKSNDVMICTYSGDLIGDFTLTRLK